ncbi:hypothetical protein CJU90_4687 [Yarrowia sp. C11]|nr:hypothetical protein CJU90_4687 [Yarrowia sp. C11]KAG5370624.1 hypothetical protein CKK34_0736 [Yarrowia sp. E02]
MFRSSDRPRFNLKLKIIELANVPQLTGVAIVRWHLTDHRSNDSRGRTEMAPIRNHRAEWNYETSMEFRMRIDDDKMLHGSSIMFDVFVESRTDRLNDKEINTSDRNNLGRVELDLAEYAQDETITHRYLLRKSKVNSLLNISITMEQLRGDTDYMIPPLSTQHIFGINAAKETSDGGAEGNTCEYRREFARGYFNSPQGVSVNKCIEDIFHGGDGWGDGGKGMYWQPPKKKSSKKKDDIKEESESNGSLSKSPSCKIAPACKIMEKITFHKNHPGNKHTPAKPSPLHASVDHETMQNESAGMPRSTEDNALGAGPKSEESAGVNVGGKRGTDRVTDLYRGFRDFQSTRREQIKQGKSFENFVINSAPPGVTLPRATDMLNGYISWYVVDEETGVEEEGQNLEGQKVAHKHFVEQKMMHDEFMRERIGVLAQESKAREEVENFNKTHGINKPVYEPLLPKSQSIIPELAHAQAIQKEADAKKKAQEVPDENAHQAATPMAPAGAKHTEQARAAYDIAPRTLEPSNSEVAPDVAGKLDAPVVNNARDTLAEYRMDADLKAMSHSEQPAGLNAAQQQQDQKTQYNELEPSKQAKFDVNPSERSSKNPELLTQPLKQSALPK